MILDIYKDSFQFASKKIPTLIVLGVLSFLSFLIVPVIFFYGYNYRVIKLSTQSMINVDDVPPDFGDFKRMFVDGLRYLVVYFVYMIIPIIVITFASQNKNGLLFIIGLILALFSSLFAFLAIPHMASNDDSLKSAFAIGEIKEIMSFVGYGRYILSYIGILIISLAVLVVVTLVIGIIFAVFDIAALSFSTAGFSAVATLGIIGGTITHLIILFLVSPYLSLFQNRCQGLIYNLRG